MPYKMNKHIHGKTNKDFWSISVRIFQGKVVMVARDGQKNLFSMWCIMCYKCGMCYKCECYKCGFMNVF